MSIYFTDSSAVVKRYLHESRSGWVRGLFVSTPPNEFYAVATVGVEVVAAVTRRVRGGTISKAGAARLCGVFLADLELDFDVVSVTDNLLRLAVVSAQMHGLRGYDAIQPAVGVETNRLLVAANLLPLTFVSADQELSAAARSEGLAVDGPNAHV